MQYSVKQRELRKKNAKRCFVFSEHRRSGYYLEKKIKEKNKQETIIFKLDVATKEEFILNEFDKIDLNGFIKIHNDEIYTNILSPQFYSLKKSSKQYYHRNHSLPLKIEFNADNIVTLNQDKSLTWYEHNSPAVICDWYITSDHNVLEYE